MELRLLRMMRLTARSAMILAGLLLAALGCGRAKDSDSYVPAAITVPGFIQEPPAYSPVPRGKRTVVATPDSGAIQGVMLLSLFAEPEAEIYFSLQDLGDSRLGQKYENPILMVPPVTVWAYALKDNSRGPTVSFVYSQTEAAFTPVALDARRLPRESAITAIPRVATVQSLAANVDAPLSAKNFVIDGDLADWEDLSQSRSRAFDPSFDVPAHLAHFDIQWFQAEEDQDHFYFAFQTRAAPAPGSHIAFVIDIGPSGITSSNFGDGSRYTGHIEVTKDQINLYLDGADTDTPDSREDEA